jgi:hypothetical protein
MEEKENRISKQATFYKKTCLFQLMSGAGMSSMQLRDELKKVFWIAFFMKKIDGGKR